MTDDTARTARAYFSDVLEAIDQIEVFHERALRYMEMANGVGGMGNNLPKSAGEYSRTEAYAVALADLASDMQRRADRLSRSVDAADAIIAKLKSRKQRRILRYIYFCGLTLQQAADKMGYQGSRRSLRRLYIRALKESEKILECRNGPCLSRGKCDI